MKTTQTQDEIELKKLFTQLDEYFTALLLNSQHLAKDETETIINQIGKILTKCENIFSNNPKKSILKYEETYEIYLANYNNVQNKGREI